MIIVRLSGALGNQLFQYAVGRALSIKNNTPLKLDTTFLSNQTAIPFVRRHFVSRPYALNLFAIKATIAEKKDIPWYGKPFFSGIIMQGIDAILRKVPILPGWEKRYTFNQNILTLKSNAYLAGFWQSERYFAEYASAIREDLVLKIALPEHIRLLREEIKQKNAVCIHVRRSDFTYSLHHGVVDKEYYDRAITYIESHTSIEHIYIFSDDLAWCKKALAFSYPTTFVEKEFSGDRDIGNFELMRVCKHFIIPNSTFSWWAAWLGENPTKIVVAPKRWFGNARLSDRDLIPKDWVRI